MASLVFGPVGEVKNAFDEVTVKTGGDEFARAAVQLDVVIEDVVENRIGRK